MHAFHGTIWSLDPFCAAGAPAAVTEEDLMLQIEVEGETDGRWMAEIPALPGLLAHGETRDHRIAKVEALALRVLADRLENGEEIPSVDGLFGAA